MTDVVVVDDTPEVVRVVARVLEAAGFSVHSTTSSLDAVDLVRRVDPDVVVLDVAMPGLDGVETCRRIRTFSDAYVLMLTGLDAEADKVVGLAVGADDYVTKPFSSPELVARVRAMLRRPRTSANLDQRGDDGPELPPRRHGPLLVEPARRRAVLDGCELDLTRIQFDLLDHLSRRPQHVWTRSALSDAVWGSGCGDPRLVDTHVAPVRRKLGDPPRQPRFIETVRGVGYRFLVPASPG